MSASESPPDRTRIRPEAATALAFWMFSTAGIFFSIFLTVLKFRSDIKCDDAALACDGITGDCSAVFTSAWATVFSVPVTVYATGYYLVLWLLAAAAILNPGVRAKVARPMLLLISAAGFLVVIVMGLYAAIELGVVCTYCSVLYLINTGLFLAAWLPTRPHLRTHLASFIRHWWGLEGISLLMIGLVFLTSVSVQRFLYLEARNKAYDNAPLECVENEEMLPSTPYTFKVDDGHKTEVVLGLFVDPACPHCRDMYYKLKDEVRRIGGCGELRVYHYPRQGEACGPNGFISVPGSSQMNACQAARAVYCAEERIEGAGILALEEIFALVRTGEKFEIEKIRKAIEEARLGFDPWSDAYKECMDSTRARNHIERQIHFAWQKHRTMETPIVYVWDRAGTGKIERYLGTTELQLLARALRSTSCAQEG